jgi:AcrR family transcriptional regulator
MPRPAYSPAEREAIETQIRSTALTLFAEGGYRGVSLRSIAKAMGWSAPALYRYFDNKDALMAELRAEGFRAIQARLEAVRHAAGTSVEAVRQAVVAYMDFAMEHTELFRLMYELDQGEIAEVPHVVSERRKAFSEAEAIAEAVCEEFNLDGDPNQMAHLMWVSVHGLATLALANQLDLGQRYEQLVEPVVQLLLRGVPTNGGMNDV